MTADNPGAWPDQMGTEASITTGTGAVYTEHKGSVKSIRLYTAAEMKAARLETVERCLSILHRRITPQYATDLGPVKAIREIEKLKEEIENE